MAPLEERLLSSLPAGAPTRPPALDPVPLDTPRSYRAFLLFCCADARLRTDSGGRALTYVAEAMRAERKQLAAWCRDRAWKARADTRSDNAATAHAIYLHLFKESFQTTELEAMAPALSSVVDLTGKKLPTHRTVLESSRMALEEIYSETGTKRLVQINTLVESAYLARLSAKIQADKNYCPSPQEVRLALQIRDTIKDQHTHSFQIQRALEGDDKVNRTTFARSERVEQARRNGEDVNAAMIDDVEELLSMLRTIAVSASQSNAFPERVQ